MNYNSELGLGIVFFILKISTSVGLQTRSMDATKELASTQLEASSAIAYRATPDSSANQVCFHFSYNSPFPRYSQLRFILNQTKSSTAKYTSALFSTNCMVFSLSSLSSPSIVTP